MVLGITQFKVLVEDIGTAPEREWSKSQQETKPFKITSLPKTVKEYLLNSITQPHTSYKNQLSRTCTQCIRITTIYFSNKELTWHSDEALESMRWFILLISTWAQHFITASKTTTSQTKKELSGMETPLLSSRKLVGSKPIMNNMSSGLPLLHLSWPKWWKTNLSQQSPRQSKKVLPWSICKSPIMMIPDFSITETIMWMLEFKRGASPPQDFRKI